MARQPGVDNTVRGFGHTLHTVLDIDPTARDAWITVTHDPSDANPGRAILWTRLTNGTWRPINMLGVATPAKSPDGEEVASVGPLDASADGQPGIINKGEQFYSNVPIRKATTRDGVIDCFVEYWPPGYTG